MWTPLSILLCVLLWRGCLWFGHSVPLKRHLMPHILETSFRFCSIILAKALFCVYMTMTPMHKAKFIKKWFPQVWCKQTWLAWTSGFVTQHHYSTSPMLLWLNGSKALQPVSETWWNAWNQSSGGCYGSILKEPSADFTLQVQLTCYCCTAQLVKPL